MGAAGTRDFVAIRIAFECPSNVFISQCAGNIPIEFVTPLSDYKARPALAREAEYVALLDVQEPVEEIVELLAEALRPERLDEASDAQIAVCVNQVTPPLASNSSDSYPGCPAPYIDERRQVRPLVACCSIRFSRLSSPIICFKCSFSVSNCRSRASSEAGSPLYCSPHRRSTLSAAGIGVAVSSLATVSSAPTVSLERWRLLPRIQIA